MTTLGSQVTCQHKDIIRVHGSNEMFEGKYKCNDCGVWGDLNINGKFATLRGRLVRELKDIQSHGFNEQQAKYLLKTQYLSKGIVINYE